MKGVPRIDRERVETALLLILTALVYRALLFGFDPYSQHRKGVEGAEGFFFSPTGGSPYLLLVLSGWLIYQRRNRFLVALDRNAGWTPSLPLLAPAALLCLWSYHVDSAEILIPSFSLMLVGGAWYLGGRRAARAFLLPALFVFLLFPPPGVLLNAVVFPLQIETADFISSILNLIGISSFPLGDRILTSHRIFQVIESCTGIRSVETMMMSSVLYAELFWRGRRHAALVIASGPVVGLLVNELRIISLVLNPFSNVEVIHTTQGIVMLVVGVLLLVVIDKLLARWIPPAGRAEWDAHYPAAPTSAAGEPLLPRRRLALLLCALALLAFGTWAIPRSNPEKGTARTIHTFPGRLGDWSFANLSVDKQYLGSVAFSDRISRRYSRNDESVELMIGDDWRMVPTMSLRSDKTALLASGVVVEMRETIELPGDGHEAQLLLTRSRKGQKLVLHWYHGIESLWTETLRALLAVDRGPTRRPGRALVVRIATDVDRGPSGLQEAEARLLEFLPLARQALADLEAPPPPRATSKPKAPEEQSGAQ